MVTKFQQERRRADFKDPPWPLDQQYGLGALHDLQHEDEPSVATIAWWMPVIIPLGGAVAAMLLAIYWDEVQSVIRGLF